MDGQQPPADRSYNYPQAQSPPLPPQQPSRAEHRRGPWSPQEDALLLKLVNGLEKVENWVKISEKVVTRSAKQCRERYHQNLKPVLLHDPISQQEGELILRLVEESGPKWADIARHLRNRSDNAVKNWYNGSKNRARRLQVKRTPQHRLSAHDHHHQQLRYAQQQQQQQQQQQYEQQQYRHQQSLSLISPGYPPRDYAGYSYQPQSECPRNGYDSHPREQHSTYLENPFPLYQSAPSAPRAPEPYRPQHTQPNGAQRSHHVPLPISTGPQSPSAACPRYSGAYDTPLPSPNSSGGFGSVASSPNDPCRNYTYTSRPQTSGSNGGGADYPHRPRDACSATCNPSSLPREKGFFKLDGQCVLPPIQPRLSDEVLYTKNLLPPTPFSLSNEAPARPGAEQETPQTRADSCMSLHNILS